MLNKEQILEIISYCDTHGVSRKKRLRELGISEWYFYESRKKYIQSEKQNPEDQSEKQEPKGNGSFIQLQQSGKVAPSTDTEMENHINPGKKLPVKTDTLTVECQTARGGMIRINGKITPELLGVLISNL